MNNSVSIFGISQKLTAHSAYILRHEIMSRSQGAEFVLAGASACGAITLTNPVDVVKTRLQLQGELRTTTAAYTGRDLSRDVVFKLGGCGGMVKNQLKGSPHGRFDFCIFF